MGSFTYYSQLNKLTGGKVKATLLLSYFLSVMDEKNYSEERVTKSQKEIFKETGLTRAEQESSRKILSDKGVLIETYENIPRRIYFKIDTRKINDLI